MKSCPLDVGILRHLVIYWSFTVLPDLELTLKNVPSGFSWSLRLMSTDGTHVEDVPERRVRFKLTKSLVDTLAITSHSLS